MGAADEQQEERSPNFESIPCVQAESVEVLHQVCSCRLCFVLITDGAKRSQKDLQGKCGTVR